jgi:hypothetical protein
VSSKSECEWHLLFTIHYSLFTIHYSLSATHYLRCLFAAIEALMIFAQGALICLTFWTRHA